MYGSKKIRAGKNVVVIIDFILNFVSVGGNGLINIL